MRVASIDLETTGLDPESCEVIEVGIVLDDLAVKDVVVENLPTFHCYVVREEYRGHPFALSMHPEIFRRIAMKEPPHTYLYPREVSDAIGNFLYGAWSPGPNDFWINAVGKNFATFDWNFLARFANFTAKGGGLRFHWKRNLVNAAGEVYKKDEEPWKFRHRVLDPATWFTYPAKDDKMPGTEECMRRAGLPVVVSHTAVDDARSVLRLIRQALALGGPVGI